MEIATSDTFTHRHVPCIPQLNCVHYRRDPPSPPRLCKRYKAFAEMLVAQYGIEKPVRISFGEDDPGPRGMFDTASDDFIPYGLWILNKPDGTQVSRVGVRCKQTQRKDRIYTAVGYIYIYSMLVSMDPVRCSE